MHVLRSLERMMTNLKVVWISLICLVAPCKCDPEDEAETIKHSHTGGDQGREQTFR